MTRQYPPEIFIGQRVLVRSNPGDRPIESEVTRLDNDKGIVYLQPLNAEHKLAARARAVMDLKGYYLHFERNTFFFAPTPMLQR